MVKGAPERVMDMCSTVVVNGKNEVIDSKKR
jgi:hypothetical protein